MRSPSRRPGVLWTAATGAAAVGVALPLAIVVSSVTAPRGAVWAHLWQTQLTGLVLNTLGLAAGVGTGTLVLGTALAWLVTGHRFPGRNLFEWALTLPLAAPAYVLGFAFLGLADAGGPLETLARALGARGLPDVRSGPAVAAVMTLAFYPYVYLLARAALADQAASALESARSLGRSRLGAFVSVTLPLARPALAAGTALAVMETLADFGTVATFGYRTLTEGIYRVWLGMFDRAAAAQLATLLLGLVLALLWAERRLRGRARFAESRRRGSGPTPLELRGWRAAGATALCSAVLGLAFVVPIGQLLWWTAATPGAAGARASLAELALTSLGLASGAALATGLLALGLAYARRLHPSRAVRMCLGVAASGYALPGAVLAVGVLGTVAWLDGALAGLTGTLPGLALTGSAAGLLYAYVVRFLAAGSQTVEASLVKIPPSLDEAARSLGCGPLGALRRVHAPLLRSGVATALLLVFVEVMKEMPATLLLRPLGLDTLAVAVWERTSESQWSEAALPALAIVAVGLLPVFGLIRLSRQRGV